MPRRPGSPVSHAARLSGGPASRHGEWRTERGERRAFQDRRRRWAYSVFYGGLHPRRRAPSRRADGRFQAVDWYSPHLLAVSIGILLLCAADAFLTLILLAGGAEELNPVMGALVYRSPAAFTAIKLGLTGFGVLALVATSRYRLLRVLPVGVVMYATFAVYAVLVGYEIWMLKTPLDSLLL